MTYPVSTLTLVCPKLFHQANMTLFPLWDDPQFTSLYSSLLSLSFLSGHIMNVSPMQLHFSPSKRANVPSPFFSHITILHYEPKLPLHHLLPRHTSVSQFSVTVLFPDTLQSSRDQDHLSVFPLYFLRIKGTACQLEAVQSAHPPHLTHRIKTDAHTNTHTLMHTCVLSDSFICSLPQSTYLQITHEHICMGTCSFSVWCCFYVFSFFKYNGKPQSQTPFPSICHLEKE